MVSSNVRAAGGILTNNTGLNTHHGSSYYDPISPGSSRRYFYFLIQFSMYT